MKKTLVLTLKIACLTILYFILFSAGSAILGPQVPRDPGVQSGALAAVLVVSLVDTLVLTLVILRSYWTGWRLILAAAFSYYGVQTFMAQIETAYFGPALGIPAEWVPRFFLTSLPIVLIFIPLAVWVLGKLRGSQEDDPAAQRLTLPPTQWAWKLALISVLYIILYFGFGYVVAWQNPALVAMYGGGENTSVFNYAVLVPFQLLRGVLWAFFALPVIRSSRGSAWQIGLLVGLLLALPMNISHLIPNPIMPDPSVRLSHFIETSTSNFIFGYLLTQLMLWRPARQAKPAVEDIPVSKNMAL